MPGTLHEWSYRAVTTVVTPLTAALFTAAGAMFVTGVISAFRTVPTVVTATYYVSTFVMVALLWAHSIRTVRQQ